MARNLDADMYAGSAYGRTTNAGTAKAKQTYSWGGKSYDSVMDMHNAIFKDSDSSDKAPVSTALAKAQPGAKKGLASKPKTTTEVDPKERFFTGINTIFTESGADLDVYKPSVDIGAIYTQEQFTGSLSAAQGYVYRADMAEQTRELIAEAMNYDQDQINAAIRDINDAALKGVTDKEMVKRYLNDMAGMGSDKPDPLGGFGVPPLTLKDVTDSDVDALSNPQPLYDMADEFANPSITTTELPSVEEEASLQETIQGLVDFSQVQGRDNPFQGGVQVALAGMTEQEFYQQANETRAMLGLPLLDVPAAEPVTEETSEGLMSKPSLEEIKRKREELRRSIAIEPAPTKEELIDSVFKAEGGYSTDRGDSGNYYQGEFIGTNHGISAPILAESLGRAPTVAEMKALTKEKAKQIAGQHYYDRFSIDTLPNKVQEIVFHAVYMGESRGVRAMQNLMDLTPDGIMGPNTRAAMKSADFTAKEYRDEFLRELQYGTEGYSNPAPTWNRHGRGWTNRFNKLAK